MAKQRGPPAITSRDVDLLLLIREEAVYAERIKDALVFSEKKIQRLVVPLMSHEQVAREMERQQYTRPTSEAERLEEVEVPLEETRVRTCRSKSKIVPRDMSTPLSDGSTKSSMPYTNPSIDTRRTVDDNDALYSEASSKGRVEFTYADLVDTLEGRKVTTVRSLRRLANLWRINPKLNKDEMLAQLIIQYARRYPDEVVAYDTRRTSSRSRRRRRMRRR